jgi:tetratricopeptide (TPR) repeat protein
MALVALSFVVGAGISLWQAIEANSARKLADERAENEAIARRRAESNLRRGNEAVEILLSRVAEERLLDEPHLEDLRKSLLSDALRLNNSFLEENADDPDARFEAAKTYRRMAHIRTQLGEPQLSAEASRKPIRILESLLAKVPEERYRRELAKSYRELSISLVSGASAPDTDAVLRRNISLQDEMLNTSANDAESLFASAHAHGLLGAALRFTDVAESHVELRRVIDIVDPLRKRYPDRLQFAECIARTHWQLGLNAHQEEKYAEAKEELLLALTGATEVLAKSPRTSEFRKTHIEVLNSLAELYLDQSELESALEYARQSESAAENLAIDYPSNRVYRLQLLWRARALTAAIYLNRHDHAAAAKEFNELLSLEPDGWMPYYLVANWLARCVEQAQQDTKLSETQRDALRGQYVEQARACVNQGSLRGANEAQALNAFAWYLATCSVVEIREPPLARQFAEKAVASEPGNALFWNTLGLARYRVGQWRSAIEALHKSMALAKGNAEAADTFFLAMAHWQLGDHQEALKWYERAVAWQSEHQPENAELSRFRAEAAILLGKTAENNE